VNADLVLLVAALDSPDDRRTLLVALAGALRTGGAA
jgi:hypothetical protein